MHGSFGEDGVIQSILSKNNIPFNGSGEKSSRNCFDKSVTKEIVMNQGVLSPKYYQTSSNTCNDHLDFKSEKYIVKPNSQGSSVGFNVIDNFENLNDAIDIALDFDNSVLIEEFIDGREITVPILGMNHFLLLKLNQNLVYMITNQNIQPANQNILVLLISY